MKPGFDGLHYLLIFIVIVQFIIMHRLAKKIRSHESFIETIVKDLN